MAAIMNSAASTLESEDSGGPDGADTRRIRAPRKPRRRPPRGRVPKPDSAKRAPMAGAVARPAKRTAGRTAVADTPAYIRAVGVELDAADKAQLRRKLGRKLGKFSPGIERASVRIEDVNGPRGGIDKRCRIKVVLSGLPSVVVEERRRALWDAIDVALARVERTVRQAVKTRRMKPRRSRARLRK